MVPSAPIWREAPLDSLVLAPQRQASSAPWRERQGIIDIDVAQAMQDVAVSPGHYSVTRPHRSRSPRKHTSMHGYRIEARLLCIARIAGHAYWVLRDDRGNALAELHGLATDRHTGQAIPIGTDATKHSLRAWHYPHEADYAKVIGVPPDRTSYLRHGQQTRTAASGDKHEILARWHTAVHAVPELNAQDLDYPDYGFKLLGATINSNSAFRTFGELMGVPVAGFPRRLQPGIGNCMLPRERIVALCYRAQTAQDQHRVETTTYAPPAGTERLFTDGESVT